MISTVIAGRTYRNKKTGDLYRVLDFAHHSENSGELLVIYRRVSNDDSRLPWARPIALFREKFDEVPE